MKKRRIVHTWKYSITHPQPAAELRMEIVVKKLQVKEYCLGMYEKI
jgi:hypothetical protein